MVPMNSFVVLGTDTDAGKTTFSLLWLAAFPDWSYWKPMETGESDSQKVRDFLPNVVVHPPVASFRDPVAPPLAAKREGRSIPNAVALVASCPSQRPLLVETFGGPFSPLNDHELQFDFVRELKLPAILIAPARLGTIGVTLACLKSLRANEVDPFAVVLMGEPDEYAREQVQIHGGQPTFSLRPPAVWTTDAIGNASNEQLETLKKLKESSVGPSWLSSLQNRDFFSIWHPYTSLQPADSPLPVISATDEFLHLADGRRIIDGISSWWTILHGHREPRLMNALKVAMSSYDHVMFAGITHPPAIRVGELLLQSAPWKGPISYFADRGRVFFSDNGSTAVEVALKMAYQFWHLQGEPQRTVFVGFEDGYHGDTFGAMAVGRDPLFFGRFEPLMFHAERVPLSPERLDEVLDKKKGTIAGVIIEPLVQGAGGMRMHPPSTLRAIHEVTKKHGVLFIADEVMTGCFRTGSFWAHSAASIKPDLICTAKTLAGGILPLAATLVSPEIVKVFDTPDRERTFFHGHSFTAHPMACAIAAENLKWLLDQPPTAPDRFARFWEQELSSLREYPNVREVRVLGTIAAVELDLPGGYLAEAAATMRQRCLELGVLLRPLGNVLYAMPPFNTSEQSLARIADAIRQAVKSVE